MKTKKRKVDESDERYNKIASDPKFRRMSQKQSKVTIDERFHGMIGGQDQRFSLNYTVDKRGRPLRKTATDDLLKFYRLDEEEEVSASASEGEEDNREIKIDLARGEGNVDSSSDEGSWDSEKEFEETEMHRTDHRWAELDADAPSVQDATSRLAVCNMNWDRIGAHDLLVLLSSFKPATGAVHSVQIFPSEFGLKRMAEEETTGPASFFEASTLSYSDNDDNDDNESQHKNVRLEKLRTYQLERLKYYYAVVVCDSCETASAIYEACNGTEYETSGTPVDLRYIPDDMKFDHAEPKEAASMMGDLSKYEPQRFDTNALKMSSAVTLTWDETDPERAKLAEKAFDLEAVDNLDLKKFVASDSEESEEGEDRYKSLMSDANRPSLFKGKNFQAESENKIEVKWDAVLDEEDQIDQDKIEQEVTPFEKYLEKRKLKRKERKAEIRRRKEMAKLNRETASSQDGEYSEPAGLDLLVFDDKEDDSKHHFKLKKLLQLQKVKEKGKKKKNRSEPQLSDQMRDNFRVDLDDNRFSALYSNNLFNIDPTDPNYKKTEAMEKIKEEKVRRRKDFYFPEIEQSGQEKVTDAVSSTNLTDLVTSSLKAKVKNWNKKLKNKKLQ